MSRLRARLENEEGFTLIELLVVIIIIGILAAIAIPVFLNQRQKGYESASKSDLRNLANFEEVYLSDKNVYGAVSDIATVEGTQYASSDQTVTIVHFDGINGYCLSAQHSGSQIWFYDSQAGGLQPRGTTACPKTTTGPSGGTLPTH